MLRLRRALFNTVTRIAGNAPVSVGRNANFLAQRVWDSVKRSYQRYSRKERPFFRRSTKPIQGGPNAPNSSPTPRE
jgi:hypothetical protein